MEINNLIIGIFFLVAVNGYSQVQKVKEITKAPAVTEFSIKTSDIDELKSFDWNTINEVFENNEINQPIKIAFEYENPSTKRNSKPSIKNLKFEMGGTQGELPDLIEKSKKMVSKFLEINETYN